MLKCASKDCPIEEEMDALELFVMSKAEKMASIRGLLKRIIPEAVKQSENDMGVDN